MPRTKDQASRNVGGSARDANKDSGNNRGPSMSESKVRSVTKVSAKGQGAATANNALKTVSRAGSMGAKVGRIAGGPVGGLMGRVAGTAIGRASFNKKKK